MINQRVIALNRRERDLLRVALTRHYMRIPLCEVPAKGKVVMALIAKVMEADEIWLKRSDLAPAAAPGPGGGKGV